MTNNIKQIRKELNISVTELAAKLNMSQSNLTKIENGQLALKPDVAEKIATALNIAPQSLFKSKTEENAGIQALPIINPEALSLPPRSTFPVATAMFNNSVGKNLAVYIAEDDAMRPPAPKNSVVLVDMNPKEGNNDGVYLIRINSKLLLRRIQYTFDGQVNLLSEHKVYPPQLIDRSQVHIEGRALAAFNLHWF